jgi:hypothetical protein
MGLENLAIIQGLESYAQFIGTFDHPILIGLAVISSVVVVSLLLWFFIISNSLKGNWIPTAVFFGIWGLIEFANLIGGGHN